MFNRLIRTYLFVCIALIGMCPHVFAIDFSQAFSQAFDQTDPISSMFHNKTAVRNIYSKALKLVKDYEIVSTNTAFDELESYYDDCPTRIRKKDIINVLLHSNSSFQDTFASILPKKTDLNPSSKDINNSYKRFFACQNIAYSMDDDYQNVSNEINRLFYDVYINSYTLSTLNQYNYGSDMFWNGTLDDSEFDVLYDVYVLGNILFEGFKESEQILFYRLPEINQIVMQGGGDIDSLLDQSSYSLGGGSSFISSSLGGTRESPSSSLLSFLSDSKINTVDVETLPTDDREIEYFIESTNTNNDFSSSLESSALVFGNQCLSSEDPSSLPVEESPVFQDPVDYLADVYDFIETVGTNPVNLSLLEAFHQKSPLSSGASTSNSGYASTLANVYAEQAFGDAAPGTCAYACNGMALHDQLACELRCVGSCIKTCNDTSIQNQVACTNIYTYQVSQCEGLSAVKKATCKSLAVAKKADCLNTIFTEEALCTSDCTCFMIAGPNGVGWEKVEDMFRIKFCKVPVQQVSTVIKRTKASSIQSIFQSIHDVLRGLRDSGQTTRKEKTDEFLDGRIKLNFADNFDFKLQVNFKPVFSQVSTETKIKANIEQNNELNKAIKGIDIENNEADNREKYIVISDYAMAQALKEPVNSYEQIDANIAKVGTITSLSENQLKLAPQDIEDIKKSKVSDTQALFVSSMITFLENNQLFWYNMQDTLLDINNMSIFLRDMIQKAK